MKSIISISLEVQFNGISHEIIKAINYHAIACLHDRAGEYRRVPVVVIGENLYEPPSYHEVPNLMDEFISEVNGSWSNSGVLDVSSFVMWKINQIHPFVNGNGRTARAMCYYVLCTKLGLPQLGRELHFLPELIRTDYRSQYVEALRDSDRANDFTPLANLVQQILLDHVLT